MKRSFSLTSGARLTGKKGRSIRLRFRPRLVAAVMSACLIRAAKHIALLACLMIAGKAAGRFAIGELAIFLLTVVATMAHLLGRALAPRPSEPRLERSP